MSEQHFLLRRLHSLTGLVPIGVFLLAHLTTNSTVLWGQLNGRAALHASTAADRGIVTFQEEVSFLNGLPFLLLIEITLWVSIAFHAGLGLVYAFSGSNNLKSYPYQNNWRYMLQRLSGYAGILFIFYHVATLRWGWTFLVPGGAKWDFHYAASMLAAAIQGGTDGVTTGGLIVSLFYFVGVSLLVFHFANGLWTMAITWGLTASAAAQRRWGYCCTALGVLLMAMAWSSIIVVVRTDPTDAFFVEKAMQGDHPAPTPAIFESVAGQQARN